MQPCPQLSISATLAVPPSSCLPVMVGGPLICFRSVLWREGAPLTCLKQQTGSRERRSPSAWGPWHMPFMTHLRRSSSKVVTPVMQPLWAAKDEDRGQGWREQGSGWLVVTTLLWANNPLREITQIGRLLALIP